MANVAAINAQLGMDVSRFKHGLKSSIMHTRSFAQDFKKQFNSMLTPIQRFQKEMTRLNVMRAGVWDKGTQTTMRLSTEQHALAVKRLRMEYSALIPTLRTAQQRFLAVGASMRRFFGGGGLMMGMAAVGTAFKGGRTSENFEKAMRGSLAIMFDVTEQQKAMMREQAKAFSGEVLASAADLAGAYYYLAQTGMDAQSAIAALPTVARFAQAGMFDLSRATDLLTDAQIAMGMASKDPIKNLQSLTHVGNVLVKASTLANASVEQFSEALTTKAAATFRLYNQTLEEGVTILAAFAAAGVKGAAGGEQTSIVMRHLAINAVENAEAFKRLGVEVFNARGKFQPMPQIIADLDRTLKGMTDRQKVLALMQLGFTKKTIASTGVLLGMSEALKEVGVGLEDVGGIMKKVSEDRLTPFQVGWNKVRQGFENLSIDVGVHVLHALGDALVETTQKTGMLTVALGFMYDAWATIQIGALKVGRLALQADLALTRPFYSDKENQLQEEKIRQISAIMTELESRLNRSTIGAKQFTQAASEMGKAIDDAGDVAKEQGDAFGLLYDEIENARKATDALLAAWAKKVDTQNLGKLTMDLRELATATSQLGGDKAWSAYEGGVKLIREFYATEKKLKDVKAGESLQKQFETPQMKFDRLSSGVKNLLNVGAIGQADFDRAMKSYRKDLQGTPPSAPALPQAMTVGSREAYSAVARGTTDKESLKVAKQQLAEIERLTQIAELELKAALDRERPVEIERM